MDLLKMLTGANTVVFNPAGGFTHTKKNHLGFQVNDESNVLMIMEKFQGLTAAGREHLELSSQSEDTDCLKSDKSLFKGTIQI